MRQGQETPANVFRLRPFPDGFVTLRVRGSRFRDPSQVRENENDLLSPSCRVPAHVRTASRLSPPIGFLFWSFADPYATQFQF